LRTEILRYRWFALVGVILGLVVVQVLLNTACGWFDVELWRQSLMTTSFMFTLVSLWGVRKISRGRLDSIFANRIRNKMKIAMNDDK
jgi:hypothetical protein